MIMDGSICTEKKSIVITNYQKIVKQKITKGSGHRFLEPNMDDL